MAPRARPSDDVLTEVFLDGLTLGRMERLRRLDDFPVVCSPTDEYMLTDGWPYSDEDDAA